MDIEKVLKPANDSKAKVVQLTELIRIDEAIDFILAKHKKASSETPVEIDG